MIKRRLCDGDQGLTFLIKKNEKKRNELTLILWLFLYMARIVFSEGCRMVWKGIVFHEDFV